MGVMLLGVCYLLAAVCALVWTCRAVRRSEGPTVAPGRRAPARPAVRPRLPEGHRPPPGLGPLSPSERFLTQEAERGLRELQVFLVDRRG